MEVEGLDIRAEFTEAGALARLFAGELSVLQYPASELEPGPHQVWLRRRAPDGPEAFALTGPSSGARVARSVDGVVLRGTRGPVAWELWWDQPGGGRFGWGLRVHNDGSEAVELDAVWTLDAALTSWDALRRNEYYVSQYLDLTPLGEGADTMIAVRQNMPGATNPWLAMGSTRPVAGWATDAAQLRAADPGTGLDLSRDLPSWRLQHEHTLAGLQTEAWSLAPGEEATLGFRAVVVGDHPKASGHEDLGWVRPVLTEGWTQAAPATGEAVPSVPTLFSPVEFAHGQEMPESELLGLVGEPNGIERGTDGRLWSWTTGGAHVVTAAKESEVLRPHGHIIRVAEGLGPQATNAAVTVWMDGTFASQLTRGHAHADPLVSIRRSYLGLIQAEGVRLFILDGEIWRLLGVPSAWAVDATSARWWYRWGARRIEVSTRLSLSEMVLQVRVEGEPLDVLVSAAGEGLDALGSDAAVLYADGRARGSQWRAVIHEAVREVRLAVGFPGDAMDSAGDHHPTPRLTGGDATAERLDALLPWLTHNALIHYQVPRGLEQFTGGAWGTRDVGQGPLGLLVALGRLDVVREVLLEIYAGQQDDGNWPQWFDYLAGHRAPGHRDSHGDIVYWPLLALGEYLQMTGDVGILDEEVGWVGRDELLAPTPVREHLAAAFGHLSSQRSADPRLPAYGHGDWNDSLQPASQELASQLVSTWTAGLEVKALEALADGMRDADAELAGRLREVARATRQGIRDSLLVDDELCGYAVVTGSGVEPLVHPRDNRTGLHHGSLQMIHAIADELLTPQEAAHHVGIIDEHLDGPVGIYLFDRPVDYHGGETHTFLRAEAASFWGREIGLMYTHAHLRWIEALLRLGLADRAWRALDLVVPDGLSALVPGARPRQSNCYYSSIDATFRDRRDAEAHAESMFDPDFGFEGGWRVYSSGPGLILRLVTEGFLGFRISREGVIVDPVLPVGDLSATLQVGHQRVQVTYEVSGPGHGVHEVEADGVVIATRPVPRRYRPGGVLIPHEFWTRLGDGHGISLKVRVGGA